MSQQPGTNGGGSGGAPGANPRVIACPDFVRYDAHGKLDTEAVRGALRQITEHCAESGVRDAILDVRGITDAPSMGQLFWIADELGSLGFAKLDRLAIVFVDRGTGRAKFFATSARIQGFNVREFTEFEDAFNWLSSAGAPAATGESSGNGAGSA